MLVTAVELTSVWVAASVDVGASVVVDSVAAGACMRRCGFEARALEMSAAATPDIMAHATSEATVAGVSGHEPEHEIMTA